MAVSRSARASSASASASTTEEVVCVGVDCASSLEVEWSDEDDAEEEGGGEEAWAESVTLLLLSSSRLLMLATGEITPVWAVAVTLRRVEEVEVEVA